MHFARSVNNSVLNTGRTMDTVAEWMKAEAFEAISLAIRMLGVQSLAVSQYAV